jgi:hypothetical protein
MAAIERILCKYPKDTFGQTFGVMKEWRSSSKVKTTILMLMKAFQSANCSSLIFIYYPPNGSKVKYVLQW